MQAEHTYWTCPAAVLYDIASDGTLGEPQTMSGRDSNLAFGGPDMPALVIVSGPLWMPAARRQAIHIAAQQGARVLSIAVLQRPDGAVCTSPHGEQLQALARRFSSVFVVEEANCADLVRRLIHAIVTPGGRAQVIGCDWNDVCYMVAGAADKCVAGYGFGCSTGPGRATSATLAALGQISAQGFGIAQARGVCIAITVARENLLGNEVKQVFSLVRARVGASVTLAHCIDLSDSMGEAAMDVDIFAFGASGPELPSLPATIVDGAIDMPAPDTDPLYELARTIVLRAQRASISLVQRNLNIGYSHASRLLDAMEGDILSSSDKNGGRTLGVSGSLIVIADEE